MGCELNCKDCRIKDCGLRGLNAFGSSGTKALPTSVEHTQTRAQLHTRIDATKAAKMVRGTSGGGYGGIPAAVEIDFNLYATDQLKAERGAKKQ